MSTVKIKLKCLGEVYISESLEYSGQEKEMVLQAIRGVTDYITFTNKNEQFYFPKEVIAKSVVSVLVD